jgi:tetratricopeptide (TPR) repeat protein
MVRTTVVTILVLSFAIELNAQWGKPSSSRSTVTSRAAPSISRVSPTSIWMSGKVVLDDGTLLTTPVAIQSSCKGRVHVEAYTDFKGNFSFELKSLNPTDTLPQGADTSSQTVVDGPPAELSKRTDGLYSLRDYWQDCELQAVLPGFTSGVVQLTEKLIGNFGLADVGTIPLYRTGKVEGLTVSATSARAPARARKEYEKGIELETKKKWNAALESFQKAVEVYPEYAAAWLEIGRLQIQKNDSGAARESLQRALAADSKFVSAYHELALLAAHNKQWQEVVGATDELLKLNPIDFPSDYLLNAVGNLYLQHYAAAEKSSLRGLELDKQHRFPRLEYVLGILFAQTHDYAAAVQHLRNYLGLSPAATDFQTVQKQINDLEELSARGAAQQ